MRPVEDQVTLDQILAVEDDDAFSTVVCPDTDILVWPALRNEFLRLIIGDRLYPTSPLVELSPGYQRRRIVVGAARASIHNVLHRPQRSEVLILATGAGLLVRDGRAFNRYTDYFATQLGDRAWTVESLFGGEWQSLPRANLRFGYLSARRVRRELESRVKVRARHTALVRELVDLASNRARDRLGWAIGDGRLASLVALGERRLATYPSEARFVAGLIKRVQPRLALVEEGCYGRMAVFNATAREAGVAVAEFQHGMITRGHDAYNVAPSLATSPAYQRTQPRDLLAYGPWWSDQAAVPLDRKIVIGNPHRTETLRSWRPTRTRNAVVVIGDGVETEAYINFCRQLSKLVPKPLRVSFRPHPRERERVRAIGAREVAIDEEADLYASLASASLVIGEASTALFEAVGLAGRVFVWDTEKSRFYLGEHSFPRFTDPAEFVALATSKHNSAGESADPESLWAPDWQERFLDYIEGRG